VTVPGPTLLSLTFDDGLDSHLDIVGPALERAGLRATFYVQLAAPPLQRRWKEWQELAARGHELGNHSMLHPAEGRRGWVTAANRIEDYSLERMETELALTNSVLSMIDGQAVRSYAYPCSIDVLGREGWPRRLFTERGLDRRRWGRLILPLLPRWGSTRRDYTPVVERLFFCARGGTPHTPGLNRYHLQALSADGLEPSGHGALLDDAAQRRWALLLWHGIDGDHGLSSTRQAFVVLLERIAADRRFLVKPVLDAARHFWR